ncbi:tol-pal system-associated acyl-CoA thioesterase [Oceanicoccus sagamiensis]|uniref:Tol-pal system-associated acyl-CoA thioesterase n=1 Tax=Oceanicoccus sagamiensis TaxID=716816 RepID=A0A1X9NDF3_9GAMM|nr:tol-pal system-associated acyl-CoA thioesterase [Oceanicoccus sagamiensis]ARN75084.1 tol-pal system-associated acyl-CoA thioesterase [Oceanicoccus sagamiensis]
MSNKSPFEWPLRVYIEDTDAGGIVYYVNYLKFMERARTEFMRSEGFDKTFIFNTDLMFVVHGIQSEYLLPARLDDKLAVTCEVSKLGKAYMLMAQQVYRISDNQRELLCRAEVKLTCVDRQSIKPRRIPAELIAALSDQS